MAFTRSAYNPVDGIKNKTAYPSAPGSETAFRKQFQDNFDQAMTAVNELQEQLENADAGVSGADNIGSALIGGVTGTTVRTQIASLKSQVDAISAGSVSDGAITTAKLADNAVTSGKIDTGAIDTNQIADEAVTTDKIANNAVTAGSISENAVTEAKINANAVTSGKIATGAVTSGKIATGAVVGANVSPGHVVGALFHKSGTQTIPTTTEKGLTWQTYTYNPDSSHSAGNTSRMISKYTGLYTIDCSVAFSAPAASTYILTIRKNGTADIASDRVDLTQSAIFVLLHAHIDCVVLNENDYIEAIVEQRSGVDKNVASNQEMTHLSMRRNVF